MDKVFRPVYHRPGEKAQNSKFANPPHAIPSCWQLAFFIQFFRFFPDFYPAVSRKNVRIRMSLMATHTKEHLDKVLNAFEHVDKKLHISTKQIA